MAGTFDPHLKTDIDWVRHYTVDKTEPYRLSNETIAAVLASTPNRWLAAAECFREGAVKTTSDTIQTKIMDDLHITYGGKSSETRIQEHADWLQKRGTWELLPARNRIFEVM